MKVRKTNADLILDDAPKVDQMWTQMLTNNESAQSNIHGLQNITNVKISSNKSRNYYYQRSYDCCLWREGALHDVPTQQSIGRFGDPAAVASSSWG